MDQYDPYFDRAYRKYKNNFLLKTEGVKIKTKLLPDVFTFISTSSSSPSVIGSNRGEWDILKKFELNETLFK